MIRRLMSSAASGAASLTSLVVSGASTLASLTVSGAASIAELVVGATGAKLNGNALYTDAGLTRKIQDNGSAVAVTGALAVSGAATASNLSGTNTGNVTIGTANGLSLAGQALSLGAADGSNAGALTAGAQTIGGDKNFTGVVTAAGVVVGASHGKLDGNALYTNAALSRKIQDNGTLIQVTGDIATTNGYGFGSLGGASQGMQRSGSNTIINAASGGYLVRLADGAGVNFLEADGTDVDIRCGTGTARPVLPGTLNVNTTAVGNVGAGEDDLITYSLPANSLVTTGRGIRIRAWGTTANNANSKTLKLYFGSAVILTTSLTANTAGKWFVEAMVFRTGASAQDYVARLHETGTSNADIEVGTATQTETGAITIKLTASDTTADNDLVAEGMVSEYV